MDIKKIRAYFDEKNNKFYILDINKKIILDNLYFNNKILSIEKLQDLCNSFLFLYYERYFLFF